MSDTVTNPVIYPQQMSFHEVARIMPFGTQWLLIDRVLSWSDEEIVVSKAIAGGEPNMAAHLRDGPSIMPGVLQIEFVNQATMLLMLLRAAKGVGEDADVQSGVLARCKGTFHSPAYIGDVITARVRISAVMGEKVMYEGEITCGERRVASISAFGAMISKDQPIPLAA